MTNGCGGKMDLYDQTLALFGLALGDLVSYVSHKHSTGGVIFRIVNDVRPVRPHTTRRTVMKKHQVFEGWSSLTMSAGRAQPAKSVEVEREETEVGAWDENGKKIMLAATRGFIRIKPVFEFFATARGKVPLGKGGTIIVGYDEIKQSLRKVDMVILGAKYVELGNIIRDIARKEGMTGETATGPTGDDDERSDQGER